MHEEKGLRYFPIVLFASVMGVAGLAISLRLIENIYEFSHMISTIVAALATVMFLINIGILIYRWIKFKEDVKVDFNHPVRMNFFGAISISLFLLGMLYYDYNESLSFIVWLTGAIVQFVLTLAVLSNLIWKLEFKLPQFNPTWFIPMVGNIVAPLSGVYHVAPWVNWTFFSIGVLFSIIYFTIFMNRIFFQDAPPAPLLPSFFILLAPPGIGFVSYVRLAGDLDIFAYILFGVAFYLGLLFLYQIRRFLSGPFFLSWWAFLFPSAAVTNATIHMQQFTGDSFLAIVYHLQVIGLILLTIYLFVKTIGLWLEGKLCVKEG